MEWPTPKWTAAIGVILIILSFVTFVIHVATTALSSAPLEYGWQRTCFLLIRQGLFLSGIIILIVGLVRYRGVE